MSWKHFKRLIEEEKLAEVALFEHKNECACYYTVFIILAVIALTVIIGIGAYYTYKNISHNKEKFSVYDYFFHPKNY